MNIKKILAAVSAMAVGAVMTAVPAFAATEAVEIDADKLLWGDPEDKGNFRIEIYNDYGATKNDPPIDRFAVSEASEITVTFTLTGAPEGDYNAAFYYASGDWSIQDESSTPVTGDGTYSITTNFGTWDDGSPKLATGITVFVIDIPEMGADAGISQDEDYDMSVITVSDLTFEVTTPDVEEAPEEESAEEEESSAVEEEDSGEEKIIEDADPEDADDEAGADRAAPATDDSAAEEADSGMSAGVIAGIVVGCVAVIGVIAAVVMKKKK